MIDFIQIGANVGPTPQGEDIVQLLINKHRWKGVLIEPLPMCFDQLKENYKNIDGLFFENIAIMDFNGTTTMRYESGGDLRIASTIGSSPRNNTDIEVPCFTLISIVEKYNLLNQPFQLLQIDAEGMDGRILLNTDFSRVKPKYIRFEKIFLEYCGSCTPDQVISYLATFGYTMTKDIFHNNISSEFDHDILLQRKKQ